MTDHTLPNFEIGNRVYFKNKQTGNGFKWRVGYRIVNIEHKGHYLHIESNLKEKLDPAMSRTLYLNCLSSYGMLTLNLAELESIYQSSR